MVRLPAGEVNTTGLIRVRANGSMQIGYRERGEVPSRWQQKVLRKKTKLSRNEDAGVSAPSNVTVSKEIDAWKRNFGRKVGQTNNPFETYTE